jgi:hypothetical protein
MRCIVLKSEYLQVYKSPKNVYLQVYEWSKVKRSTALFRRTPFLREDLFGAAGF